MGHPTLATLTLASKRLGVHHINRGQRVGHPILEIPTLASKEVVLNLQGSRQGPRTHRHIRVMRMVIGIQQGVHRLAIRVGEVVSGVSHGRGMMEWGMKSPAQSLGLHLLPRIILDIALRSRQVLRMVALLESMRMVRRKAGEGRRTRNMERKVARPRTS